MPRSRNWPDDVELPFGKHRGDTLAEILAADPGYLAWLAEEADIRSEGLRTAIDRFVSDHEDEIEEGRQRNRFHREERR